MHNIEIVYIGNLKTNVLHLDSMESMSTEAPVDNQGLGQNFSPTDLLVSSLGACILTIMGIVANSRKFNINGTKMEIYKTMSNKPRMISKITINIYFPKKIENKYRKILENSTSKCPVYRSLNCKIVKEINYYY